MSLGNCGRCGAPVIEDSARLRYCSAESTHDIYYEEDYDYEDEEEDDDWFNDDWTEYERILTAAMEEA